MANGKDVASPAKICMTNDSKGFGLGSVLTSNCSLVAFTAGDQLSVGMVELLLDGEAGVGVVGADGGGPTARVTLPCSSNS